MRWAHRYPISWRVPLALVLAIAVVGGGMLAWTQRSHRASHMAQARAFAESVHQLTMAGLTSLMIVGEGNRRDLFLDQIKHANDVRSLRVVRGSEVTREYGRGRDSEQPRGEAELQVLDRGTPVFEERVDEGGPHLHAVMPVVAQRSYLGRDCLGCHHVPEGTVLGAVSLEISLARIQAVQEASLREALLGALACLALLAALASFAVSRIVSVPLLRLAENLRALARGHIHKAARLTPRGRDEIAEVVRAFGQVLDKAQETLRAERIAGDVFEHALEGIVVTDATGTIVRVNPSFTRTTGYAAEEALGRNPRMLNSGRHDAAFYRAFWDALGTTGEWQGEIWNRRKNGEIYPEWLTISRVADEHGRVQNYVAIFSDITEQKREEARMRHQAQHDPLTGLPNRALFRDRLEQALVQAKRREGQLAAMFIDLDRFKQVNDTLGHDGGDELLRQVARRVRSAVRESDTVARLGGDEFTVLLPEIGSAEAAIVVGEKILEAIARPFVVLGREVSVTCSVGVSLYPHHGGDAATLLAHADTAMYQIKRAGRASCRIFDAAAAGAKDGPRS